MTRTAEQARVRVWLKQKGKTQAWLAAQVGLSDASVSRMLSGESVPSVKTARVIYRLTDVKLPDAADRAALV